MYRQPHSGFTRIPYVQSCEISSADGSRSGLLCNLSLLGAFLHAEPLLPAGTPVRLRFTLPDDEETIDTPAAVTWINDAEPSDASALPPGFGVRFTALSAQELRRIASLVQSFQAEPRPLPGRPEPETAKLRIPFVAPCQLTTSEGIARGSVCNLSAHGVYVSAETIPGTGDAVIVSFRLPGVVERFERAAVVTWRNPEGPDRVRALPPGFGLRFANLSEDDRVFLHRLVNQFSSGLPQPRA